MPSPNRVMGSKKKILNGDLPVFRESTKDASKENDQNLASLNYDDGLNGLRAALLSDMSDE